FVADLKYHRPANFLIGIHAGSKQGRWLSKRWPYFKELKSRLASRGIPVASFGGPEEYIDGTENRCGGSIARSSYRTTAGLHISRVHWGFLLWSCLRRRIHSRICRCR